MKKFALSLIILLGLCLVVGFGTNTAHAATEKAAVTHQQIEKNLLSVDGVTDTRVFIYDDCALIAVRPGKQLQKTQTEKLENNITDLMNQKYPQFTNVKVTFSVKVFFAIEQLNYLIETGKVDSEDFFNRPPHKMPKIKPVPDSDNAN